MKLFRVFSTAVSVVVIDQIVKFLVRYYRPDYPLITITSNTGAAFGLFKNNSNLLMIIGIAASIVLIILAFKLPKKEKLAHYSLGLFLGGAIGNVIDRLLFGGVLDFIDLHFWPIFNIADAANMIGAIGLVYYLHKKK
ncbi:MAG: signal peptidase II [Nanoarchaeota archaeon]